MRMGLQLAQFQSSAPASLTPVMNALVATLAAIAVFAWVWRAEREAWLGWLIVTWLLWAARYVLGLVPTEAWPIGSGVLGNSLGTALFFLRDAAFTLTLFHLGARWALPAWLVMLLPLALAYLGLPAAQGIADRANAYLLLQHGALWAIGAIVVGTSPRLDSRARFLAAAGLLAYALVVAGSAWPGNAAFWNAFGLGLASAVHLSVALGIGIGVHKRFLDDREAAELRVARALEYAVRGMVPMCAYCRSVRGPDDAWTSLEAFVAQRTESPVVDTRCPNCAARALLAGPGAQSFTTP